MKLKKIKAFEGIYILLFFFIAISGFLKNFFGIPRSLLIYFSIFSITFFSIYVLLFKNNLKIFLQKKIGFFYILFLLGFLGVFLYNDNSLVERLYGFLDFVFIVSIYIFILNLANFKYDVLLIIKSYQLLFIFISIFGLFQYFFSKYLPVKLLVLDGASIFSFYGTSIVRPTALVGNTIEYGGIVLLGFIFIISKIYFCRYNKKEYLYLFIIFLSIVFSYSRASLAGAFLTIFLVNFVFILKFRKINKNLKYLILFLFMGVLFLFFGTPFLINRIIYPDPSTIGSNLEHYEDILNSINTIKKNFFCGVGIGSQGIHGTGLKIITDGFIFQIILEYGVFVSFIYFAFILAICLYLYKNIVYINVFTVFSLISLVIFHLLGIINSSYISPVNLIIIWVSVGLALIEIRKREA